MPAFKLVLLALLSMFAASCGSETADSSKAAAAEGSPSPAAVAADPGELMFVLEDRTVAKGDTVCLDVRVRNFNNILSMQYSMNWNPKTLRFLKLDKFNLKDLSGNNFGKNRTDQGKLGTSWFDLAVKSITLPDNTPIYQVCFVAIGEPGSADQVYFSSEPVIIEISNSAEQLLNLAFKRANISIQ